MGRCISSSLESQETLFGLVISGFNFEDVSLK